MSTFKKVLALTLALAMVLSVSAFAGYSKDAYKDSAAINEDCEEAVELMYALEIMKGDNNGNFNPEATITRAEIAKMIYVILNYGNDDQGVNYKGGKFFTDVTAGAWYEGYVNFCATIKLVQGRPDGTFGPNDPVTTAEAAKMLLTAIGYSAADRGYTGANWAGNVLSDAYIVGLLKGYDYATTGYAPRQWVAVMFENALLNAQTYNTMYPVITGGLLTSTSTSYATLTMGEKYYDLAEVTTYLTGTDTAEVEKGHKAKDGYLNFNNKVTIKSKELGLADLGQEFRVIYAKGDDNIAYSIRNTGTSDVAEGLAKDLSYEIAYSTSSNNDNNKYVYTIGEMTAKTESKVNAFFVEAGNTSCLEDINLKAFVDEQKIVNNVVRAIDKNDDGEIDYIIVTPVEYAEITKVATSKKYGDYVQAKKADGEVFKYKADGANLYIDSVILTEDELAKGDVVKYTWNNDASRFNFEVLDVIDAVEFESRKISKNQYTFADETYNVADNAFFSEDWSTESEVKTGKLGTDYDIIVDGDLLVWALPTVDNYTMDEINEKLAVLIEADVRNVSDDNDKFVKLLTIDGEISWYAYDVAGAKKYNDDVVLTWAELKPDDNDENAVWDQLVIVHTNDDGEVYLETVPNGEFNMTTTLVDFVDNGKGDLEVEEGEAELDLYKLAEENKFFAKIEDEYCVVTVADLTDGTYSGIYAQALVKTGSRYDTMVGGYMIIDEADPTTASGYLFITDKAARETEDYVYHTALFADGEEKEIVVAKVTGPFENDYAYYFTFDGDEYTLTFAWKTMKEIKFVDEDGEMWFGKYDMLDTTDYDTIAVKTVLNDRTQPDGEWVDPVVTVEFMTAEELAEVIAEYYGEDETYEYGYKTYEQTELNTKNVCLFVEITIDMVENQYDAE